MSIGFLLGNSFSSGGMSPSARLRKEREDVAYAKRNGDHAWLKAHNEEKAREIERCKAIGSADYWER